jgi:hypothetical protein
MPALNKDAVLQILTRLIERKEQSVASRSRIRTQTHRGLQSERLELMRETKAAIQQSVTDEQLKEAVFNYLIKNAKNLYVIAKAKVGKATDGYAIVSQFQYYGLGKFHHEIAGLVAFDLKEVARRAEVHLDLFSTEQALTVLGNALKEKRQKAQELIDDYRMDLDNTDKAVVNGRRSQYAKEREMTSLTSLFESIDKIDELYQRLDRDKDIIPKRQVVHDHTLHPFEIAVMPNVGLISGDAKPSRLYFLNRTPHHEGVATSDDLTDYKEFKDQPPRGPQ